MDTLANTLANAGVETLVALLVSVSTTDASLVEFPLPMNVLLYDFPYGFPYDFPYDFPHTFSMARLNLSRGSSYDSVRNSS